MGSFPCFIYKYNESLIRTKNENNLNYLLSFAYFHNCSQSWVVLNLFPPYFILLLSGMLLNRKSNQQKWRILNVSLGLWSTKLDCIN